MRWDRNFLRFLQRLLEQLGTPFFWLFFALSWLLYRLFLIVSSVYRGIRFETRVFRAMSDLLFARKKSQPKKKYSEKRRRHYGLAIVGGILLLIGGTFWWFILKDLPHPEELITRQQMLTTKIYDRNGVLLYKLFKNQNRSIISLDDLPPYVAQATLAIEDAEFYQHPGFSIRGISRAFQANLHSDSLQGGSTITQQLVKNTLLSSERTFIRKLKEFVLALEVEYVFTKNEILTMYLNEVGYGGTAYGIEEAAAYYFDKPAADLTLAEAALIAGLPASPTTYSPFGSRSDLAVYRQHLVLERMRQEGMISVEEYQKALDEELVFALPKNDILAPHFVMMVKEWLVEHYGESLLQTGGLEVVTTLDYEIYRQAEAAMAEELDSLERLHVSNGAVLVTQPATGEILAMVGSKDYFDSTIDGQVNVTLRPRQPGSSIKPLTYALALEEKALTASSLIDDSPITYQTPGSPAYSPQNYDGAFHGKVTVRQALANSYNVPAVKTLAMVGVSSLVDFGREMGITTWNNPERFGLSLTLGGGEVLMTDMAVAYGVFANGGYKVPLTSVLSVMDYRGKVLYTYECDDCLKDRVIKATTAYTISDILADNQARSAAFGLHSVLNIPGFKVAVKTGTTNDLRDNWTFGYTPDYLVGTWVGNNDNSPMSQVASGITGASPIWNSVMTSLLQTATAHQDFLEPEGIISVAICVPTQTLACEACPVIRNELFVEGSEPTKTCSATDFEEVTTETTVEEKVRGRDKILDGIINKRNKN